MIRKMKKYGYISMGIYVLCLVLTACGFGAPNDVDMLDLTDDLPILEKEPEPHSIKTEDLKLGIYVDVTPSMSGFLGMETDEYKELVPETKYAICLNEVDKIVAAKFGNSDKCQRRFKIVRKRRPNFVVSRRGM